MKSINFSSLLMLVVIIATVSCKKNSSVALSEKAPEDNQYDLIEETSVVPLLNASDEHFTQAYEAFEANKYPEAAAHIREGINALKREAKNENGEVSKSADAEYNRLSNLANQVEKGEVTSVEVLNNAFNQAEITVAHEYLLLSEDYLFKGDEENSHKNLKHAVSKIQHASKHAAQSVKLESEQLLEESNKLLEDIESGAKVDEKRLKDHLDKLITYVEKHLSKEEQVK